MTHPLSRMLAQTFKPAAPRRTDPHRRAREQAKRLASLVGCEIEPMSGGGMNVWAPANCASDPYDGDHYAADWSDALERVRRYAE